MAASENIKSRAGEALMVCLPRRGIVETFYLVIENKRSVSYRSNMDYGNKEGAVVRICVM